MWGIAGGIITVILLGCSTPAQDLKLSGMKPLDKQKGVHLERIRDTTDMAFYKAHNIEWITVISFAYQEDYDSGELRHFRRDTARMLRRDSMRVNTLLKCKEAGLKTFFKPHIWIRDPSQGKWRADIFPKGNADWLSWSEDYMEYIVRMARLAERGEADMFCVGMELTAIAVNKPEFFRRVSAEVRKVYSGALTYGANWSANIGEYEFWDAMDYMGIQAYYPLSKATHPTVEALNKGWKPHLNKLSKLYQQHQKPIVFTELGYKSTTSSAHEPWLWIQDDSQEYELSIETQSNCYEAFFDSVWPQPWMAGVHFWKMVTDYMGRDNMMENMDFTPQGKPTMEVIQEGFSR